MLDKTKNQKLGCMYTMEYSLATKKEDDVMEFPTRLMELKGIVLNEVN